MEVTANAGDPFLSRTLSLPHQLLQFFEACITAPERKSFLASLLRQDPALLANFLDTVSGQPPTLPHRADGDWLLQLLSQLSNNALQQFALNTATPWLTLDMEEPHWLLLRDLHYRSHCVAEVTRQLAGHTDATDVDEAWLAGAMHNLGKLMFFSLSPNRFLSSRSPVLLGGEAREAEQKLWGTDHISLATQRIREWPLDSYVADAVTFLYQEPDQYRCATALVQLLHCGELLSHESDLDDSLARHADALLGIGERDLQSSLFHGREAARQLKWSQLDDDAFCARQQEAVVELRRAVGNLAACTIDQTDLYCSDGEAELTDTAVRQLKRFFGEALIFELSADRRWLTGSPASDQPQRFADMRAPFQPGDNLPAHALLEEEIVDSIHAEEFALSLLDKQLQSLVGGEGFCCIPLKHDQLPVGVAVVRLSDAGQRAMARDPRVRGTTGTLARLVAGNRAAGGGRPEEAANLVREMYHELSNPLSAVRNHLYVLKRGLDEEGRDTLARIEDDITRLGDLLNQYRQRALNRRQTNEATDINQVARETIARVAAQLAQPRTIETDLDQRLPPVDTNRLAVQQILTNLLNNALEATRPEQPVSVTTRGNWRVGEREYIEVCVADQGPGLPEAVLKQLFRPVSSTKGGEHSGLGLNIVKSLADEIGATLHCHSSDSGTRFQILIPYRPPMNDNNEKQTHENFARQSLAQH